MKFFSAFALLLALYLNPGFVQDEETPAKTGDVTLGKDAHVYRWVQGWGELPDGVGLGNTHGCIVTDSLGRVYFNTDTKNAVCIFDDKGEFVNAWGGRTFEGGLHGMTIAEEDGTEYLYLTHTGRHEVMKTTLEGEVVWTKGFPEEAGVYNKKEQFNPTGIAVLPSGEFFVADGYGLSWIHKYDKDGNWVKKFGGPGSKEGQLRTPHGIWIDTRGASPALVVADRENNRLQFFDLDGAFLSMTTGLRRPCNVHQRSKELVVAELTGRVTILGEKNEILCHLGEQPDPRKRARNDVMKDAWKPGEFISPHSARWDDEGNLYVMDWVREGRVTKLERVR